MKRLLITLATLAAVAGAQAQSVTSNGTPTGSSGAIGSTTDTLAKFDSMLGTLTSATLTLYSSVGGTITLSGASTTQVNASDLVNFRFSSSIADLNALLGDLSVYMSSTGAGGNTNPISGAASTNSTYTGSNLMSALSGTSADTYTISCTPTSTVMGGTATTQQGCGASITYNYTANAVPEPSSIALLGIALAGVGVASRRRKAV